MGAGFFLCPPERKDGQMDGLQEDAGLGEEGAAQDGSQQQAAQAQQVAGSEKGPEGGATAIDGSAGGARAGYEAALAERDARIAELEGQIAEAAKTAESAEKLRAEMDELRRQGEEQRVSFELTMAGARNVKAATALLPDYGNDIEKLRAAEPWLFGAVAVPAQPAGATGLPNAGAATDGSATLRRWRRIAGLDDGEKEE